VGSMIVLKLWLLSKLQQISLKPSVNFVHSFCTILCGILCGIPTFCSDSPILFISLLTCFLLCSGTDETCGIDVPWPHVTRDTHVGLVACGWLKVILWGSRVIFWASPRLVFSLACSSTDESLGGEEGGGIEDDDNDEYHKGGEEGGRGTVES
jgi:hypothetical protein